MLADVLNDPYVTVKADPPILRAKPSVHVAPMPVTVVAEPKVRPFVVNV